MNTSTYNNSTVTNATHNNCPIEEESISWSQTDITKLKHSMVEHALEEIRDNRRSKKMKLEAWEWLMSEKNTDNGFSFHHCCLEIGIDVVILRSMLNEMLETGVIKL